MGITREISCITPATNHFYAERWPVITPRLRQSKKFTKAHSENVTVPYAVAILGEVRTNIVCYPESANFRYMNINVAKIKFTYNSKTISYTNFWLYDITIRHSKSVHIRKRLANTAHCSHLGNCFQLLPHTDTHKHLSICIHCSTYQCHSWYTDSQASGQLSDIHVSNLTLHLAQLTDTNYTSYYILYTSPNNAYMYQ